MIFTLFGVLVCVTLFFLSFERKEEQKAALEADLLAAPTEIATTVQSPLAGPRPDTVEPSIPKKNPIGSISPFKPESILNGDPRAKIGVDRRQLRADTEISKELETVKLGMPEDSVEVPKATYGKESIIFRNLQLKDENGEIPVDGMAKAREQMERMKAEQQSRAIAAGKPEGLKFAGIEPGEWSWQGPGNIGGRMRSIVIHPTDPNKMWVGSVGGGIWKMTNAGTSWLPVNDFLASLAVSTMVMDPTNPNIMYAGTGEGLAQAPGDGLQGDGIFRTTDGGATWNQLPSTKVTDPLVCPTGTPCPWIYVNRLAISPDGTTILAATSTGILRSTDGGATWTRTTIVIRPYLDIDFDPVNSQLAVAGADGLTVFTTNGGLTWFGAGFSPGINLGGRAELAYAPSSPNIVYASVNRNGGKVYQSIDGGQSFAEVNNGNSLLGTQGGYANIVWVNPQDPTFVLVGGLDIWRSTDSGATFTQISNWPNAPTSSAHADHHMIVAHPGFNNSTNKTVYFGNDGGIYRANDVSTVAQTTGWTNLNNSLGITQFYGAAANSAGVIVGGTQDNGSLKSNATNPNAWTTTIGGDGGFVAADPTDTNYFYTEYVYLTLQRSTNAGGSASYIYSRWV